MNHASSPTLNSALKMSVNFSISYDNSNDIVSTSDLVGHDHLIWFKFQHTGFILSFSHTPHSICQQILLT